MGGLAAPGSRGARAAGILLLGGPISEPGGASWPACPRCPLFSFYLRLFFLPPVCFSDFARHTFSLVCPFPVSRPVCRGVCTVSLGTFSRPPAHSSLICSSPSVPAPPWTTSCANLTFLPALFAPDRERLSFRPSGCRFVQRPVTWRDGTAWKCLGKALKFPFHKARPCPRSSSDGEREKARS